MSASDDEVSTISISSINELVVKKEAAYPDDLAMNFKPRPTSMPDLYYVNLSLIKENNEANSLIKSILAQNIEYMNSNLKLKNECNQLRVEYRALSEAGAQQKEKIAKLELELKKNIKDKFSDETKSRSSRNNVSNFKDCKHAREMAKRVCRVYEKGIMSSLRESRQLVDELYSTMKFEERQYNFKPINSINEEESFQTDYNEIDIAFHDLELNRVCVENRSQKSFDLFGCRFKSTLNNVEMIDYTFTSSLVIEPGAKTNLWSEVSKNKKNKKPSDFVIDKEFGFMRNIGECSDVENIIRDRLIDELGNVSFK